MEHYFYHCQRTHEFWGAMLRWWNNLEVPKSNAFKEEDILLGIPWEDHMGKLLNCCILIGKVCIYRQKSNNKEPNIYVFHCELKKFINIEENISVKNNSHDMFLLEYGAIVDVL